MSCHFTLSLQPELIHSGDVILFRHAVRKSKTCLYIVMSETPRKKLSSRGRPAKQPSCNDFCHVCSVNFKTYYRQFNQNCFSTENLFVEPNRAGVEKCCLVDLLWNLSDKHRSAQQKMKLNFPPAMSFMFSRLDWQWIQVRSVYQSDLPRRWLAW